MTWQGDLEDLATILEDYASRIDETAGDIKRTIGEIEEATSKEIKEAGETGFDNGWEQARKEFEKEG